MSPPMAGHGAYDFSAFGRRAAPLLVVHGSDDDAGRHGGKRFGGNSDIFKLIPDGVPFDELNLSRRFFKQQAKPVLADYQCVLNLITDPDQHPQSLALLAKLLRGFKGRVINRPEAVMRTGREQVARRLAGIGGLHVPKVIRLRSPKAAAAAAAAERAGAAYPVIVRQAGTHTGKIITVAAGADELEAACSSGGELIVIEFVDFRSGDGLYRKCRLWSIGGRTIFRHLIVSENWNVHVSERLRFMLDHDHLLAEEQRLLERPEGAFDPPVHAAFDEIKKRLGLDYFGMDFALGRDGRPILFEANATMNFFPLSLHPRFSYLARIEEPAQAAFAAMLGLRR